MKDYNGEELIVKSTGEIIDDVGMIISKKEIERNLKFKKREELKKNKNSLDDFYFLLFGERDIFKIGLKNESIARIIYLASFVDYDGIIKYNGKPIEKSELMSILNISKNTFYEFYKEMVSSDVFIENKNGTISLKNKLFIKGALKDNRGGVRIFTSMIQFLYTNTKSKDHFDLGLCFKLIPYINQKHNIFCYNTKEKCEEKINPLTIYDICKIFGYSKQRKNLVFKKLMKFKIKNSEEIFNAFIYIVNDGSDIYKGKIAINPTLIYGGKIEDYGSAKLYFYNHSKKYNENLDIFYN